MRHQVLLDVGDDGEWIIIQPKLFDRDLNFSFNPPANYIPSIQFPEIPHSDWLCRIKNASRQGELRKELAEKVLVALDRLPELDSDQRVGICFSGGKESEAITMLACIKYPLERIFAMFADTHDEWPETYTFIPQFMEWIGVQDVRYLDSIGIHKLLEEKIPCWPIMKRRHCTKNLKMLPMRDHLDEQGFDQVLKVKRGARFRPTHLRQGADIIVQQPAPLLISGERHMEGMGRSTLPIEPTRDDLLMRVTARPVIEWSIVDVWEFIFLMQSPYNPVYHWVKRVACAGCPFASDEEMYTLGQHHPQKLQQWGRTEEMIGIPRLGGIAFHTILNGLVQKNFSIGLESIHDITTFGGFCTEFKNYFKRFGLTFLFHSTINRHISNLHFIVIPGNHCAHFIQKK